MSDSDSDYEREYPRTEDDRLYQRRMSYFDDDDDDNVDFMHIQSDDEENDDGQHLIDTVYHGIDYPPEPAKINKSNDAYNRDDIDMTYKSSSNNLNNLTTKAIASSGIQGTIVQDEKENAQLSNSTAYNPSMKAGQPQRFSVTTANPMTNTYDIQACTPSKSKWNWRNFLGKDIYEVLFIGISLFSACITLALQIYIFILFFENQSEIDGTELKRKEVATYLALFICAVIYQVIVTMQAIKSKTTIQVSLLLTFLGCMCIYSGIQLSELKKTGANSGFYDRSVQGCVVAIIVILVVAFVVQGSIFFLKFRGDINHDVFKKIGGNKQLASYLKFFELHRALLYFDGFFFPAFTLQFLILIPVSKVELGLTIIVIPVTLLLLLWADYCASNEIVYGSALSFVGYLLGLVYAFFKVIRVYIHNTNRNEPYPGRKSITMFAVFSIILLFVTFGLEIIVCSNYGKGLKKFTARTFFFKRKDLVEDDIEKNDTSYQNNQLLLD